MASNGTWMWYGYEKLQNASGTSFTLHDPAAIQAVRPALDRPEGLWLHGYWKYDWRETFVKIDAISAEGTFIRNPSTPPQYPFTNGCRFYGVGSLAFVDAPGEWFIDVDAATLYHIPLRPLSPETDVLVSRLDSVVTSSDAHNLTFANLEISAARGSVMSLSNAVNTSIVNSTISSSGSACLEYHGFDGFISGNSVNGCGTSGISVQSGDISALTSGRTSVIGNTVTNFSLVVRTYTPAVGFNGVGITIAGNSISHGPHTAIQGGGNDCMIERNVIRHMCFECTDVGAFYVGRSWSQRGNVLRYNTFDTVRSTERLAQAGESQNAIYLDDQMSGWTIEGNTVINAHTAILVGGGRRNTVVSNIFLNNDRDIMFDNRGMTWQLNYCRKNCTAPPGAHGGYQPACFYNKLKELNYLEPPYSTHYDGVLPKIFDDHPCTPVYNSFVGNRYCHRKVQGGGQFINQSPSTIQSWFSAISNNSEMCSDERTESQPSPVSQPRDNRFDWIASIERDGGHHQLEARTYFIDRQYVLPSGTVLLGAGSEESQATTTIVAVPTKEAHQSGVYHGCGANHINRVGFVLGSNVHVGRLHYVGFDKARFPDSHPLCGGAPFETPGCASAYCDKATNTSYLVGTGKGIYNTKVEDITVAGGTVQNAVWMPQTVSKACQNVTFRNIAVRGKCDEPGPCKGSGTWADGINIHGAHRNIRVEGCTIQHSGDDAFAMWSAGDVQTNISFRGCTAVRPRYPRTWLASCFAQYGGNFSEFVNNTCIGTGERGAIYFTNGFKGTFATNAYSAVIGIDFNDSGKPLCSVHGAIRAPGCSPHL